MFKRCILAVVIIMLCFAGCRKESKGVVGVWQIREVARQSDGALITGKPLPSIFIFTSGHYSMLWALTTKPPQLFVGNPTCYIMFTFRGEK